MFVDATNITVKVDKPFSPYDIAVYLAFSELNSVANLYHDYGDTTLPLTFTSPDIPVSTPVTVIVFGISEGVEYLGVKDILVRANQIVTIEVQEATGAQILDEMEKLNE
ncbi:MAG: hypothetical protein SH857_19030 [Chitinophagales bacterium]|nr:hypothetical protein [Chitinophagales bacterium]